MEERVKLKDSYAVQRGGTRDSALLRNRIEGVHGEVLAWAVATSHVQVHGPAAARVCINVCGPGYTKGQVDVHGLSCHQMLPEGPEDIMI